MYSKKNRIFNLHWIKTRGCSLIQLNRTGKNAVSKENMANHLGHELNVHDQNYKLPLQCIERGEVGHSLLSMVRGTFMKESKTLEQSFSKSTITGSNNKEDDMIFFPLPITL